MPLKRVKDEDIVPVNDSEDPKHNFNNNQRGFISAAMHIAKSRA
jgi:hypothetical protein